MVVLFIFKEIKFVDNSFTNITFKYDSHFVEHFFFCRWTQQWNPQNLVTKNNDKTSALYHFMQLI